MCSDVNPRSLARVLDPEPIDRGIAGPRAAVAAVFHSLDASPANWAPEMLFIQRATKETDPWSGQMALPGGRVDPGDEDSFATAEREALEEVDLDLSTAQRIGSLTDLDGGRANNRLVAVSAHAYWLAGPRPVLKPNYEVDSIVWVPLDDLLDPARYVDYTYPATGAVFPGIQLDEPTQVIWGLTLRFLADLFERLGEPFII